MEKRKYQRVTFQADAVARGNGFELGGKVENLSMKGLFLKATGDLGDGPLRLTIHLSGCSSKLSIELVGKVVRKTDEGTAIEFLEMDLDSFIHLRNVVSYNSDDADAIMDEYYRSLAC